MKIVQLMPGTGDFYCENCLRDAALIHALRRLGHDVSVLPLYLPPLAVEDFQTGPIFFGGINVYLQQNWALFRRLPRWLDRLLDRPGLLRRFAGRGGRIDARQLGEMTLSMLRGRQGRQAKEFQRLMDYLRRGPRPDAVFLSNALLAGLARPMARELGVSVVCMLRDEDEWLDALGDSARACWKALAQCAADVDAFIAPSRYYGDLMAQRLGLQPRRVHVIHDGIDLDGYAQPGPLAQVPTVGFLSRLCHQKGLDLLVEAIGLLRQRKGLADVRLRVAGGQTQQDHRFVSSLRSVVEGSSLAGRVEFLPNLDRSGKQQFLRSLSVLCVPSRHAEAFGLFVLESLAAGVPVVLPRLGAFAELANVLPGIVLCDGPRAETAADAMAPLLLDSARAYELGQAGRREVFANFGVDRMASDIVRVLQGINSETAPAEAQRAQGEPPHGDRMTSPHGQE